jgi:hypothetical protein
MEWRIQTKEEAEQAEKDWWDSLPQEELDRIAWNEKHPRCDACGQFLRKRVVVPGGLDLGAPLQSDWISHYVQDYWGEWDHV